MGYCISVRVMSFRIKDENKKAALKAMRGLKGQETCGDHFSFSWVDADFHQLGTLEEVLKAWRYYPKTDPETGDIISLDFGGEKWGDDRLLFDTLAPYVEAGSKIEYLGEDGNKWRFVFDGKTLKESRPQVTWSDEG